MRPVTSATGGGSFASASGSVGRFGIAVANGSAIRLRSTGGRPWRAEEVSASCFARGESNGSMIATFTPRPSIPAA
jgi:hypothetical protein